MPKGVPVATFALNGATNAGILAAQILGIQDIELRQRIENHKNDMKEAVKNMADSL
ncbi:MAG: AIR carboxylase family protein [Schleiferiaceae bacterium]|nr:AIR carboxylase family protein [Schleiferiaceae bacterium]